MRLTTDSINSVRFIGVALVLVLSIITAGCGKNAGQSSQGITIRWACFAGPRIDAFRESLGKNFERSTPGVHVVYEPIASSGYNTKILTELAGGAPPDIFNIPGADPISLIKRDALLDLTPYIKRDKEFWGKIRPNVMKGMYYNGRIYSVTGNNGIIVLFYNKKLFQESGVAFPNPQWKWDDFLIAARKLTKKDADGRVTQYGCVVCGGALQAMRKSFGGKLWSDDKSRCVVDNQQNREALQFFIDLSNKYKVSPTVSDFKNTQGPSEMFMSGRLAMMVAGSWEIAGLKDAGIEWSIAPMPKGSIDGTCIYYNLYGIYNHTKNPEMAYKFLKSMLSEESISATMESGDTLPMRSQGKEIDSFFAGYKNISLAEKKAILLELGNAYDYYHEFNNAAIDPTLLLNVWETNCDKLYYNLSSPQQALSTIQTQINELLKKKTDVRKK